MSSCINSLQEDGMTEKGQEKTRERFEERRQRRIARRRGEILAAAARVFADKGYANTTTRELADAADIAEGTLYNYFGGKREILLAIVNETQDPIEAILQNASKLQEREDIVALVEKGIDTFASQLPFTRTLLMEAWVDDLILRDFVMDRLQRIGLQVQAFIVRRIEEGIFRPVDPELATQMILGMFLAPMLPVLRGVAPPPSPEERHALAKASVDLLLDGIRVREN
jgi:AcrR family transcriptional regulator